MELSSHLPLSLNRELRGAGLLRAASILADDMAIEFGIKLIGAEVAGIVSATACRFTATPDPCSPGDCAINAGPDGSLTVVLQ